MDYTNGMTRRTLEPPFPAKCSISSLSSLSEPSIETENLTVIPGSVIIPTSTLPTYLVTELSVARLNAIHSHLWLAGRPGNTHALHRQRMLGREILVTEQTDLHLVWQNHSINIKPLPPFLLDHAFFSRYICAPSASASASSPLRDTLYGTACGLLYSYAELVRHESDFHIAIAAHLLPPSMTWPQWSILSAFLRLSLHPSSPHVNKRYKYGELRLSRLNLITRLLAPKSERCLRGYHATYKQYGTFFSRNFGWLALVFAYLSVVLSAMQVAQVKENTAFDEASWGFAVAVIVAVCATLGLMVALFVGLVLWNLVATVKKQREKVGGRHEKLEEARCGTTND